MSRTSGLPYNSKLFDETVLERFIEEENRDPIPEQERRIEALEDWLDWIPDDPDKINEVGLEDSFRKKIFEDVLGYTPFPASSASIWVKPPRNQTRCDGTPDFVLGRFSKDEDHEFNVAGELKPPGVDLDSPQPRKDKRSPVEQAFQYGESLLGVEWIIVTNMREIRLYSVESQQNFAQIHLDTCVVGEQPKEQWYKLIYLFSEPYLLGDDPPSPVSNLFEKSLAYKGEISEDFYEVYYEIRTDLFAAFQDEAGDEYDRSELLQAVQRLLDRLLFIYYCEDAPKPLIEPDALKKVVDAANQLPGPGDSKIYDHLKAFFREVDAGSDSSSAYKIPGYNGELFKEHEIVDSISLPDELHNGSEYRYEVELPTGEKRNIQGVWGLHAFDFWSELNEHLLGHIFEKSLSDIVEIEKGEEADLSERMSERKNFGIFYTTQVLTDYISSQVVDSFLEEASLDADGSGSVEQAEADLEQKIQCLKELKVLDPACGSGAFLVSSFRELHLRLRRLDQSLNSLRNRSAGPLLDQAEHFSNAEVLKNGFFGADLLPQAVEIAKLALWLKTARRNETVADLSDNFFAGDSLRISDLEKALSVELPEFDLVVGNPPWGGEMQDDALSAASEALDLPPDIDRLDSWEVFIHLGVHALNEGGRLALVLPDTFFSPEKSQIRRFLLEEMRLEKLLSLGPDWFGSSVRMGSVYLQAKKADYDDSATFDGLLLTGEMREAAISGKTPLAQIEHNYARNIPISRCLNSESASIEVFRGDDDDKIMERMTGNGILMKDFCNWHRGEEISKAGLLWRCPACQKLTTPGRDKKGGKYYPTECPRCETEFTDEESDDVHIVDDSSPSDIDSVPFVDGDDINRRYKAISPKKHFMVGHDSWDAKDESFYKSPKVFIRQAGVGLNAMLDLQLDAYCPQSVYTWQIQDKWQKQGYDHRFLYACLQSRMLAFFVSKKFGEVDPDRAHAKLTITRIKQLPIPKVDFSNQDEKDYHDEICDLVDKMLKSGSVGSRIDFKIDNLIRELWGLSNEDAKHIHSELKALPKSQPLKELYPSKFS